MQPFSRSILLLVLVVTFGGCCPSSDLVARTLFRLKTGRPAGDDPCLVRPSSLDNVVLIAPFLHDYGCSLQAVMVGCTFYEDPDAAGAAIMSQWDWSSLSSEQRAQRAKTLVEDLLHNVGPSVVPSSRTAFTFEDTPDYHSITTSVQDDGTILVRVWTRKPPGMVNAYTYRRFKYHFRPEGTVQGERIEQFSVSGDRVAEAQEK